jgi:hypothetical protein
MIVSGDDDLRVLGSYRGIAIVSPAECLARARLTGSPFHMSFIA